MSTPNDMIVHTLKTSKKMLRRFTEDLTAAELLHRPTPKANCVAWLLGHLTLSNRRAASAMGVSVFPGLPEGFESFSREEGCPQANEFGDTEELLPLCETMIGVLIDAVKKKDIEELDAKLEKPFEPAKTVGELANFMGLHIMMHVGQITIIRRSLGKPPMT